MRLMRKPWASGVDATRSLIFLAVFILVNTIFSSYFGMSLRTNYGTFCRSTSQLTFQAEARATHSYYSLIRTLLSMHSKPRMASLSRGEFFILCQPQQNETMALTNLQFLNCLSKSKISSGSGLRLLRTRSTGIRST